VNIIDQFEAGFRALLRHRLRAGRLNGTIRLIWRSRRLALSPEPR